MHMSRLPARAAVFVVLCLSGVVFANAAAGVSDERVNLPEAPGSIDGVGENANAEGNQGAVNYRVAVEVPQGFPGLTPEVAFSYSSGGGADVLGMGWSMPNFSIERMTAKGLQKYDVDDRFVVDGSNELVRVGTAGADATYRLRFEGTWIRYTWKNRGTGEGGYWLAEFPDGKRGYYGADEMGVSEPTARVTVPTTQKTFRYHLVALTDRFGHAMRLSWIKDAGGTALLDRVDYLFDGANARHSVRMSYEARGDILSDGRPGFEMKLTQRLKDVRIFSGAEMIRSYVINYEADAVSGGSSRISGISRFGRGGVAYPVNFSFQYSKTLGGACDATCEKPFVKDMGSLGVSFGTGRATLIDINGDALPDVLASDANGVHTFYYARLDADGRVSFASTGMPATPRASTSTVGSSPFVLGDPRVQVIDVNGDGFTDITQAKVPTLLCNNGSGDWVPQAMCSGSAAPGLPSGFQPEDDSADPAQADPKYVRFFDYDNDKRIDWLRTAAGGGSTEVMVNTPTGFNTVSVNNIGAVFDDEPLQLADMNGDGLQDPVRLIISGSLVTVSYRLNLGYGVWSDTPTSWRSLSVDLGDASQASVAEIQDVNGDTLADVVAVVGNVVKVALNRNGDRFDAVRTIDQAALGQGTMPTRAMDTVVAYADMNGNGSDDIVWMQGNGTIAYLELFPVRPNLISRIDNGIGAVQVFTYGTSIAEQARDAAAAMPWLNKVPNPMTVVKRIIAFVTLTANDMNGASAPTGLQNIIDLRYHSGFYDGIEKQFRGYEAVDRELVSDMSRDAQEPGLIVESYDVGKTSPTLAGKTLSRKVFAGPASARELLRESRYEFQACAVAQIPNGTLPLPTFACQRANTDVLVERDAANAVTARVERDYDGYGNVTSLRDLGVVNRGTPEMPSACAACASSGTFGAPCGMMCLGDESFVSSTFIEPGTATSNEWLVGFQSSTTTGAVAAMPQTETRTYYDGPDFEGLALGQMTKGTTTRVERRTGPNATDLITVNRYRRDMHGNVVESIEGNGSTTNTTSFRRIYTMEPAGLHTLSVEIRTGAMGVSGIRRDTVYDTIFEVTGQSSNWYPVNGSMPLASAQQTRYRYDEHGRISKIVEPGDTDATASQEFVYALAAPSSKITTLQRSTSSGPQDIVTAQCLDGRGRVFQRRSQIGSNAFFVSGFVEFDGQNAVVRRYQPYTSTSAACDTMPPANVPSTSYTYDALGRFLTETEADGSFSKVEYRPLKVSYFDADDTDMSSPYANTPEVESFDGMARMTSISRYLTSGGTPAVTSFTYDAMGNMATVRDALGNVQTQTYDRLGRLSRVDSTNGGTTTFEYDANGNETKRTDARNVVLRSEYDGANRRVASYVEGNEAATRRTWTFDFLQGCVECTNAGGELVSTSWPGSEWGGSDRLGYDPKGNLVYNRRTIGSTDFVVRRRYDGADRQVGITFPAGLAIDRTFDARGRTLTIPNVLSNVTYTERGEVDTLTQANGTSTSYSYDARLRMTGLVVTAASGPVMQLGFTRNRSGELQSITDGALAGRVRRDGTLTHDSWGRLTKAVLSNGSAMETLDFTYDVIDNVLTKTSSLGAQSRAHVGTLSYESTRPNAVVDAAGVARGYDAAGSLTSRGAFTYTRDHLNRIESAAGGSKPGSYFYDDLDRVVKVEGDSVTMYVDEDFEVRDGIAVAYARFGDDRVARLESDAIAATVLSDLAPLSGNTPMGDQTIDIADAWIAQAASVGVQQLSGGPTPSNVGHLLSSAARRLLLEDIVWLHSDHMNSIVLATNVSGAVVGEQSFYPAGEVRERQGYVDEAGFTGQFFDEATGLIHFRYRDYDPVTGRWDRPDPAYTELNNKLVRALGQATTAYAYVGNNFDGATDPMGLAGTPTTPPPTGGGTGGGTGGAAKQPSRKASRGLLIGQIVASSISAVLSIVSAVGQTIASGTGPNGDSQMAMRYGAVGAAGAGVGALATGLGAAYDIKQEYGSKTAAAPPQNQTQPTPPTTPPPSSPPTTPPPPPPTGNVQSSPPSSPPSGNGGTLRRSSTLNRSRSSTLRQSVSGGSGTPPVPPPQSSKPSSTPTSSSTTPNSK